MLLNSRLKKLEKAVRVAPCSICRDWWTGPIVVREDTDPPAPQDPDGCSSCGRHRPEGLILEVVWVRPKGLEDRPRPLMEP
jgi:hypothetical protein